MTTTHPVMKSGEHRKTDSRWDGGPWPMVSLRRVVWFVVGFGVACSTPQGSPQLEDNGGIADTALSGDLRGDAPLPEDTVQGDDEAVDVRHDVPYDLGADHSGDWLDAGGDQKPDDLGTDKSEPEDLPDLSDVVTQDIHVDAADGLDSECTPHCQNRACGDDGCGGQCGVCQEGFLCLLEDGGTLCHPDCGLLCAGMECGSVPEAPECVCGICSSANPCWDAVCSQGTCELVENSASCDDGNPCTSSDTCVAGICAGTWLPADQLAQLSCVCTSDADCVALDDGDDCNGNLKCLSFGDVKVCAKAQGTERSCDDELNCTEDSCSQSQCSHELLPFFCLIPELGCAPYATASPSNECLRCYPDSSTQEWSSAPDGTACGVGNVCFGGACCDRVGHCTGRQCGSDGCGGTCGTCFAGFSCVSGVCTPGICAPQCSGKQCGPDACGGSCGACPAGQVCLVDGTCFCVPQCAGKTCGNNGCGGNCGTCSDGYSCVSGVCTPGVCTPECSGKQCGPDGCGGSCGTCAIDQACNAQGTCTCVPNCAGRNCGSDGCGGSCGSCTDTDSLFCTSAACIDGVCGRAVTAFFCVIQETCLPSGTENPDTVCQKCLPNTNPWEWSPVAAGTSCGTGLTCHGGQCCPYDCNGKNCGPDGCGGTCGECALGNDACYDGVCGVCGDGNTVDWDGCNSGVISEFRINATTSGWQTKPWVAVGADNRVLVIWYNESAEGPGQGIVGAMYDPVSGVVGPETLYYPGRQVASVIAKPDGGYVIGIGADATQTGGFLIALDSEGSATGDPVTFDTLTPTAVELFGGADSSFVLTTAPPPGGISMNYTKRFSYDLQYLADVPQTKIGACSNKPRYPNLAMFPDGSYIFAYRGSCSSNGSLPYIYTGGCDSGSTIIPDAGTIPSISTGSRGGVGMLPGGLGAVVYFGTGVQGVLVAHNGVHLSGSSKLSTSADPVTVGYSEPIPRLAALTDGTVAVAWTGKTTTETVGVFVRKIGMKGFTSLEAKGPEQQANLYTNGDQWDPKVAASKQGWFVVVWGSADQDGSSSGIFARRYDVNGLELPRKDNP